MDRPPHLRLALDPSDRGQEPVTRSTDVDIIETGVQPLGVTILPLPCPEWCDRHREASPGWVVHEGVQEVIDGDYGRPLVRLRPVMGMACGEDTPPVVAVVWSGESDIELSVSDARRVADALHRRADALDGYPRP